MLAVRKSHVKTKKRTLVLNNLKSGINQFVRFFPVVCELDPLPFHHAKGLYLYVIYATI